MPKVEPRALGVSPVVLTVTAAYAGGWVSNWINVEQINRISLLCTFVPVDATTFELRFEVDDFDELNGYEGWRFASDGTAEVNEVVVTAANLPSTGRISLPFLAGGSARARLLAKKTGGVGSPTLSMSVLREDQRDS